MKDYFSAQSARYAQFRPVYPRVLFEYILGYVNRRDLAWDCGTGNGQTAAMLADNFLQVHGSDISGMQLAHAVQRENITYANEPAERSGLRDNSVDLVTVSQALHWFDLNTFYTEVRRVSAAHGIIAAWTYPLMNAGPDINPFIKNFYSVLLAEYWDKEREYVDNEYKTLPFPFRELPSETFSIETTWTPADMEGYLYTWSALQKYISIHNSDPVPDVMHQLKKSWKEDERRGILFPVHLKIGFVH